MGDECYGKTLSMIQGIETDETAITALMNQLVGRGETAGIVLTNYKKDGKKFRNRLTVGPLYDDIDGRNSHKITHLIGILQEISDSDLGTEKQSMRIWEMYLYKNYLIECVREYKLNNLI